MYVDGLFAQTPVSLPGVCGLRTVHLPRRKQDEYDGSVWRWCWTKKLLLAGFCRVRSFLVDLLEAHDNDSLFLTPDVLLC